MDVSTSLGPIQLKNPVIAASGTAGYGLEPAVVTDLDLLGGVILKSVTLEPRKGNPCPRIWETSSGMLNSVGLENMGVRALVEEVLPALEGCGFKVVASIAGETRDEYARIASILEGAPVLDAIEVNVSCPNVERGGLQFGSDPVTAAGVVKAVCQSVSLPVFAKLSVAASDMAAVAEAVASSGATGLSLVNTIPGMAIDARRRRPRLGGVTGGLSGPAIKPVALKAVWDCYRATGLPVIGGGGIHDVDDVLEFLVAGASAVSIGTACFLDPWRLLGIVEALPAALEEVGALSAGELVGSLRI